MLCAAMLLYGGTLTAAARDLDTPYMVIDRASGNVLAEHRSFDRWYPASLTKLMTLYVTLKAMAAGEVEDGSPVTMSKLASRQPPSKMGYQPGVTLRLDTAIKILIVKSANDIAIALAESVAGTVPAFVARMNDEAERLGMNDSHFVNPNGLHSADQYSSARDMALLSRQILEEFPDFAHYFAIPAIKTGDTVHYSYNLLLERFSGADGMKTGFVCSSGYNMVASATRSGRQLIAVVLGTFSQGDRAVAAATALLDGFARQGGQDIRRFMRTGAPRPAVDQRKTMCSETALKARYDPGAGDAQIDSPVLEPRRVTARPEPVSTGGTDAPPSEAYASRQSGPVRKIPVPTPRPQFSRLDVDGNPAVISATDSRSVPLPVWRPQ